MTLDHDKIDLNERKWDKRARTYDRKHFDFMRWMQKRVIELIELKPGLHFLDIGCGTGWAVYYVAGLLQGNGQFEGIDVSGKMIETAQAKSTGHPHIKFHKTDAENLPYQDSIFDVIICTNSFHHHPSPIGSLKEIRRVLAPGGRIIIMDAGNDDFFMRFVNDLASKAENEHVRFYSSREFQNLYQQAGLTYLQSRTIFYPLKVHLAEK